jgi:hypothetical protein
MSRSETTRSFDANFYMKKRNDNLLAWQFLIYNIENWAVDEGRELYKQENGCGALTEWTWASATDTDFAKVWFDLPFFMKDGCVERAIVSSGGPKIKCVHSGNKFGRDLQSLDASPSNLDASPSNLDRRQADNEQPHDVQYQVAHLHKRARTSATGTYHSHSGTLTYTYPPSFTSTLYVPMDWTGTNDTVTLTWTSDVSLVIPISARVTTYTTTIEVLTDDTTSTTLPSSSTSPNSARASSATSGTTSAPSAEASCMVDVTFHTTYATLSGESILVAGSPQELGGWNVTKALELNASSSTTWNGTVKLHPGANVSYKFIRLQKDGTAFWEADPNRQMITPQCDQPGSLTGGQWQSALNQCTTRNVTFEVSIPTKPGEAIYVVGSNDELGQWNVNRAIALNHTGNDLIWRGNISLSTGEDVLYKYIKYGRDGGTQWEADPNRKFTVPSECNLSLVQRDRWQTS